MYIVNSKEVQVAPETRCIGTQTPALFYRNMAVQTVIEHRDAEYVDAETNTYIENVFSDEEEQTDLDTGADPGFFSSMA